MEKEKKSNSFLPRLKTVLIVGSGGRENSLAWAIAKADTVEKVFVAPGNGGTENYSKCSRIVIEECNGDEILRSCKSLEVDLVVIGSEKPLSEGLANLLRDNEVVVFGPNKEGAQLEASKDWAKQLMLEANIPTAKHWRSNNKQEAMEILHRASKPLVVKADGLASGKGVTVCKSIQETKLAIEVAFAGKFGEAGNKIILEECLQGPEVSIFAISDGNNLEILPPAQDHKRLLEGDKGPNTGGMGAYAPAKILSEVQLKEINEKILFPTIEALKRRNIDYRGVIYAGLMLTKEGPKVIEYNCRFGDPECQALIPLFGSEFAQVLQAAAIGSIDKAPKLKTSSLFSACVIATASGYPENPTKGDLISIQLEEKYSHPIQLFHSGTDKDNDGNLITNGGRVISVVAQGENYDEAFDRVYDAINQVKFNGINFRKDIGYQVRNKN